MFDRVASWSIEVARHALLEAVAAAEDRHAPRVRREEHRRLARRVAGADDVDVEAVRVRRLAAGGAVGDALAGEPVEALDREPPPRDAAGEDDRPRAQDVAAVEVHLARRRRRSASIVPRDEDLGAEPPRLLQRAARQLVARHARREAEVVLDPRRRAGLAARRLALDDDRPQALRRAVHGGGQPGRPGADDHRVVLARPPARCRGRAARPRGGAAAARRSCRRRRGSPASRPRPAAGRPTARSASGASGVSHLKVIWLRSRKRRRLGARRVPAMPDDDRARRRRLGREALQARARRRSGARASRPTSLRDVGRRRRDGVVVVRLDPHARATPRPRGSRPGRPCRA